MILQRWQPRMKLHKSSTSAAPPLINLSSVPALRSRRCFSLALWGLRLAPNLEKRKTPRLPWWLSGKESACQCSRHRLNPWSRKNPMCSGTTKPPCHNYGDCARAPSDHSCEAPAPRSPCSAMRSLHARGRVVPTRHNERKARAAAKTQCNQK